MLHRVDVFECFKIFFYNLSGEREKKGFLLSKTEYLVNYYDIDSVERG